ncbi:tRNA uridine(34) 5-carboxymethylaminomethyl modification radical SAM/GNAT enzyme Elp3 [Candidatus Gracilibacteria bacterium]|nr:tRNA uridine(34) 5-carboxymethylaminomethyl modification radical SAM/GNAT enzyme Elp3 [Candidatus Gracilibacteria bacterium]
MNCKAKEGALRYFDEIGFSGKIFSDESDLKSNFFNGIFFLNGGKKNFDEKKNFLISKLNYEGILVFFDENGDSEIFEKDGVSLEFLEKLEKKLKQKNALRGEKSKFFETCVLNIFKEKSSEKIKNEIPKKTFILKAYQKFLKEGKIKKSEILEKFLVRKKIRSLSGVLPITLFTKPFPCPGKCIFCPDDVKMPKSYLSEETVSQRALRTEFSAFDQISDRIEASKIMGHNTEKLEIIILGGTFPSYPKDYQEEFIKEIFGAANGIKKSEIKNFSLEKLQEINEKTEHKIVGISVEIRPDSGTDEILSFLRYLGVTRVEMGVQSLDNAVIEKNKRGCTTEDVQKTTKKLRKYGFKIMYHMMTGLYGSTKEIDKKSFYDLFHSPFYHPDQLKIYPCLLLKGTELEENAKKLNYRPNSDEEIFELVKYIKKNCIPYHTRIGRITRDVPAQLILGGSKKSNIRENISDLVKKSGIKCKCIRCREIRDEKFDNFEIFVEKIEVNGGVDFYIEARTKEEKCLGLIRLFIPENTKNTIFKALENKGIIRELHVYGKIASILSPGEKQSNEESILKPDINILSNPNFFKAYPGEISIKTSEKQQNKTQHKGLGEILIKKSEEIVKEKFKNLNGIAIISAVGTRGYYAKFGYKLEETYMVKNFS